MTKRHWACDKGFHSYVIQWPKELEAEVMAGIPHPMPDVLTCSRCGATKPFKRG